MEITKEDILSSLKNDILDNLSDDCYEWIFEQDNDVQREFNRRLTESIKTTLENKEDKTQLINNIAQIYVNTYLDEILNLVSQKIVDEIFKTDIFKKITDKDTLINSFIEIIKR